MDRKEIKWLYYLRPNGEWFPESLCIQAVKSTTNCIEALNSHIHKFNKVYFYWIQNHKGKRRNWTEILYSKNTVGSENSSDEVEKKFDAASQLIPEDRLISIDIPVRHVPRGRGTSAWG